MRERIKILFGLLGLMAVAWCATSFEDFLARKKREKQKAHQERIESVIEDLRIQCRARWPIRGADKCLRVAMGKVEGLF